MLVCRTTTTRVLLPPCQVQHAGLTRDVMPAPVWRRHSARSDGGDYTALEV